MANTTKKKTTAETDAVIESEAPIIPKQVDINQYITVKNGAQGVLVYKSAHTGEKFEWDEFGSEQEIELKELKNAKNSAKKFFINNWFMFDSDFDWVIDYLGVRQYYKHSLTVDNFDSIFDKSPADLKRLIGEMSAGQKKTVTYRAAQKIQDGEIDSRKKIAALEEALGVELIER